MRLWQVFLAVGLIGLVSVSGAGAQARVQVGDVGVRYEFGTQVTVTARLEAGNPLQSATLFIQPQGKPEALAFPLQPAADGRVEYRYAVQPGVLRPFERIAFWFGVTLADGQVLASDRFTFRYDDNRFAWQTLESGPLRMHWAAGDAAFGQQALDRALAGLEAARRLVPAEPPNPLDIFVYASAADLQSALNRPAQDWVAGHADPDLGVVLVSIAPGPQQSLEMDRQFPHELVHVLLYARTGAGYASLPEWLREGLASLAELTPDPDASRALEIASRTNSLIPLADLCGSFPPDAERAYLAYAESGSFVGFLYDAFGTQGLDSLISAYSGGQGCGPGAAAALGKSLAQLESEWRESVLGENRAGAALRNLAPYIIVALVVLLVPLWQVFARKQERSDENEHFLE
ncbi:MAG: peptidase MA family metallohydrolase [Chloroflexota bacterium]